MNFRVLLLTAISGLTLMSPAVSAKTFQSVQDVQRVLDAVFGRVNQSVIDRRMLNYVFFDSNTCATCSAEMKKQRAAYFRNQMGTDFEHLQRYYKQHLAEVKYAYQFTGDNYPNDEPFARSAEHVMETPVFTGCTDFAKAFIHEAIRLGYTKNSLKFVLLMAEDGFKNACDGNMGLPMKRWGSGGHDVVAVKISVKWYYLNTTSQKADLLEIDASNSRRLAPVQFKSMQGAPWKLLLAGVFPVDEYLLPIKLDRVLNIYVSGNPQCGICTK
jgi:hypothetical protein